MGTADTLPRLLTIDQLAEHLGTSRRHIRRLVDERRIPFLKVGRFIRFDPDEVSQWLDQARHEAVRRPGRRTHPAGTFGSPGMAWSGRRRP
ncbi:MAG TPA: helix-turn-helix domain-containing protein [Acidimicrobiales bacterium]|nr:helix-turn-helix domain-containing protein [Acidimicrobiales bacterium]